RAHALPDFLVPGTLVLADVDAGDLPEIDLGLMRARLVAARNEIATLRLDRAERGNDVLRSLDARRIALRSEQDEVVVHHRITLDAEAFGEKLFLGRFGVDEHHVGIATARG